MKPNSSFDPDFDTSPRRSMWVTTARWHIFLVLLTVGVALLPVRPAPAPALARAEAPVPAPLRLTAEQIPLAAPGALARIQPGDSFVVMADPGIDRQMVHQAPLDIDEKMVIRPPGERARSPFMIVPPVGQPGLVPIPAPPGSAPSEGDNEPGGLLDTPPSLEPR
jgi:hypothetical protein